MFPPIYIALLHHPVLNKHGEIVTTSITNFDLHDLARTATTYGVKRCFIVTPNEAQKKMVDYIKSYWMEGIGSEYNPDRRAAFEGLEIKDDLDQCCLTIESLDGIAPQLVATTARILPGQIDCPSLRKELSSSKQPVLLVFGTGWGLAPEILSRADRVLCPIRGGAPYNHLPVRAAVAIVLDRLIGEMKNEECRMKNKR